MKVLEITPHFAPNLGGVETHLADLVGALSARGWGVFVLTYQPLTTKASWKIYERKSKVSVLRIPWIAGLFYKLVRFPILEFLYLLPGLFLAVPWVLLTENPDVVHGHGLVAGFVSVFWGKIFGKRVLVSTHSIYNFPKSGLYRNFARWIFETSDFSMGLSRQATEEIKSLGIQKNKVGTFTYWIDLNKFAAISNKQEAKSKLGWKERFSVLFVGRLVPGKGVRELLEATKNLSPEITVTIIGTGPLASEVQQATKKRNIRFIDGVANEKLPLYYQAADVVVVPSTHEEGFGRVILESLACGTPVIGSRRGAIPEAMDETVGILIDVTPENIRQAVEYFYKNKEELERLSKKARKFAEKRYSETNVETIIKAYQV